MRRRERGTRVFRLGLGVDVAGERYSVVRLHGGRHGYADAVVLAGPELRAAVGTRAAQHAVPRVQLVGADAVGGGEGVAVVALLGLRVGVAVARDGVGLRRGGNGGFVGGGGGGAAA